MAKTYVGIDPGKHGFIAVLRGDGGTEFLSIEDSGDREVSEFLRVLAAAECYAVIEDVHAIFGASAKATFEFGYCKGWLVGLLPAHGIAFSMVAPKSWQQGVWERCDKVTKEGRVRPKETSVRCAARIFPNVDLRRNERCKTVSEDKCDALLMAEYGRRNNL